MNKKNTRNNRKVKRTSFKRNPQKSARIKSNKLQKVSSTKVGKVSFKARATTLLRRILRIKN